MATPAEVRTAIDRLYEAWETNGGPSPDTRDEIIIAARDLGSDLPDNLEDLANTVWDLRMSGDPADDHQADTLIAEALS